MFYSYPKIRESLETYLAGQSLPNKFKKVDWVVTEKIHGANFCMITDGKSVQCAKRKSLLQMDDNFFGYQHILSKHEQIILELFYQIADEHTLEIYVYCELFGGAYPHSKVNDNPLFTAIQTGVYYSPNIEVCIFDQSSFRKPASLGQCH
jgi:Rnl2 family RNA ligase